jgi:hypothetical protein
LSHVLADAYSYWHRHTPSISQRFVHELRHGTTTGPRLASGEHILRRFTNEAGQVIATDRALYRDGADRGWLRIAWPDIAIVGWSRAEHALTLRLWPSGASDREVRLPGDPALAAFADERVAATQLLITHTEIERGLIATVTAVRRPEDDAVRWWVLIDDHEATDDPAFQAACARVIAELRGLTGC